MIPAGSQGAHLSLRARRRSSALSEASLLLTTGAVVWASLSWIQKEAPLPAASELRSFVATGAATAFLVLAAGLVAVGSRIVLVPLFLAWIAWSVPLTLAAAQLPSVAFLGFAWAAIVTYFVVRQPVAPRTRGLAEGDDLGAFLSPAVLVTGTCGLILVTLAIGHRLTRVPLGMWAVFALLAVPSIIATAAEWALARRGRLDAWKVAALSLVSVGGAAMVLLRWPFQGPGVGLLVLALRVAISVVGAARAHELHTDLAVFLWKRPALLVVLTFVVLCAAGGLVLKFPACTVQPIAMIDALFTSVSAACVTGLVVLDTPRDFTFIGQVVILALIQVGGLGIMTLSALATLVLGGTFASAEEEGLAEAVGASTPGAMARLVRAIAIATVVIEALGALILFPGFLAMGSPAIDAAWKAVFHSISAFCNAGFALQSDNLIPYREDPWILYPISALIILGGLGFGVIAGLHDIARRRARRASLHSKLVLSTTAFLAFGGALAFLALEWNASLAGLPFGDKLHNAWFQSITHRTAGFNSIDFAQIGPATVFVGMLLMFVGGSSGSTAGGIKTTTAAVLVLAVRAVLARRGDVEAFGRRIAVSVVYRAAAVTALSAAFLCVGIIVLLHTQPVPFASTCFEAFSAFGTVGLSLGITSSLDPVGKIVIMTLMLAGRTGPFTMAVLFHQAAPKRLKYTAEEVMVG